MSIVIVIVTVIDVVAAGVTAFAYQKKILCFENSLGSEETGGEENQPLNNATTSSRLSPGRASSASGTTLTNPRLSGTTVYGDPHALSRSRHNSIASATVTP